MVLFPTRNWPSWTAALRNLSVKPRLKLEILLCALPIILSHECSISRILKKILGLRIDTSLSQILKCAYGIRFSRHLIKAEMNGVFFRRVASLLALRKTKSFLADTSYGQTVAGEVGSIINSCPDPLQDGEGEHLSDLTKLNPMVKRKQNIGARVRSLRKRKGFTLAKMANECGCSPSLLSQIETGTVNPSFSTMESISSALGVSLAELVYDEANDRGNTFCLVRSQEKRS